MRFARQLALISIKGVHTAVWLLVEASMVYVLYAGIKGRSDRNVAIAGAVVATETLVFLGNGARCPLTDLAQAFSAPTRKSRTCPAGPRRPWLRPRPQRTAPGAPSSCVLARNADDSALHARNLRASALGADDGSVTDIFLPRWLAHILPAIHVPLVVAAVYLHGRTIVRRSRSR